MHVNTPVVKALMYLRGVSEPMLANLVHITLEDLQAWLYDVGEDSDERVPFETQIEILRILGVSGETPRGDVVHYWRIHETLFSRPATSYWALNIMLKAFGKAQAVFIARESDPSFSFKAQAHFGLRFADFMVILEVTAHPLRTISFDPVNMPDLSWVPDTFGVLLPELEFDRLEPGSMKVKGLTQYLTYTTEMTQWERLRETALENGIRADQVAALLMGNIGPARLGSDAPPAAPATAEPTEMAATAEDAPGANEPAAVEQAPAPKAAGRVTSRPSSEGATGNATSRASSIARAAQTAQKDSAPEEMRLFVTPVKSAEKAHLRSVA